MKASDHLVECLETENVEYVFGLPGEELEDLLFSLQASDIEFIPVRHEQGAAFMADVYGRLTGEAGVCLSTLGPGATNLLTGVADAHLGRTRPPVVEPRSRHDYRSRRSRARGGVPPLQPRRRTGCRHLGRPQ